MADDFHRAPTTAGGASDEAAIRDVGTWVDKVLGEPGVSEFFFSNRERHREMCAEYWAAERVWRDACDAAALRVVEAGAMREPLQDETHDDRQSYEVLGWFPNHLADAFRDRSRSTVPEDSPIRRWPNLSDHRLPAATAVILRDPRLRDRDEHLDEKGTHFWALVWVECRLPHRPLPPNSAKAMRSRSLEDRLAFACAKLLAVRDDACEIPLVPEAERVWTEESGFTIDVAHHALRCRTVCAGRTIWAREGRLVRELQRLVTKEMKRAGLLRPAGAAAPPASVQRGFAPDRDDFIVLEVLVRERATLNLISLTEMASAAGGPKSRETVGGIVTKLASARLVIDGRASRAGIAASDEGIEFVRHRGAADADPTTNRR